MQPMRAQPYAGGPEYAILRGHVLVGRGRPCCRAGLPRQRRLALESIDPGRVAASGGLGKPTDRRAAALQSSNAIPAAAAALMTCGIVLSSPRM